MSSKAKKFFLLLLAALLAGGAAVFAFFYLFIPAERRKGAEEVLKAAVGKAEALRAAAALVDTQAKAQVAKVEVRVEEEKQRDPVQFANDLISDREKKP